MLKVLDGDVRVMHLLLPLSTNWLRRVPVIYLYPYIRNNLRWWEEWTLSKQFRNGHHKKFSRTEKNENSGLWKYPRAMKTKNRSTFRKGSIFRPRQVHICKCSRQEQYRSKANFNDEEACARLTFHLFIFVLLKNLHWQRTSQLEPATETCRSFVSRTRQGNLFTNTAPCTKQESGSHETYLWYSLTHRKNLSSVVARVQKTTTKKEVNLHWPLHKKMGPEGVLCMFACV